MTRNPSPLWKSLALLAAFWAALVPLFATWLARDQVYAPWDMARHSTSVLLLHDYILQAKLYRLYALDALYPPLYYLLAVPASFVSTHPDAYCFGNALALLALIWATYLLGRTLAGEAAGLTAGLLVPAYVLVTWMCCRPMTDLTLAAAVAWSLWLLARGRPLDEGRQAHALGASLGLGMLAKWPYAFFIAPPLAWYLFQYAKDRKGQWRSLAFWRPILWLAVWPLVLAGPWYALHWPALFSKFGRHVSGQIARMEGAPMGLSSAVLGYYLRQLNGQYLTWPTRALLFLGIAAALWEAWRGRGLRSGPEARRPSGWIHLMLAFAGGYIVLTLIPTKDSRLILPAVSIMAAASAPCVLLVPRKARPVGVGLAALASFALVWRTLFQLSPPDRTDYKVEETAGWLVAKMRAEHRPRLVALTIPNDWRLNDTALHYALFRLDRNASARGCLEPIETVSARKYDCIVILDPPEPDTSLCPRGEENTSAVLKDPRWSCAAQFRRGDDRTIKVFFPARGAR